LSRLVLLTPPEVVFMMHMHGARALELADPEGGLRFVDGAGATVAVMPPAVMIDAAGTHSDAVRLVLARGADGTQLLHLAADGGWLDEPGRRWPVAVDPTVVVPSPAIDTTLDSGQPTTTFGGSTTLRIGSTGGASPTAQRALLRFDVQSAFSEPVVLWDAELELSRVSSSSAVTVAAHALATSFTESAVTWQRRDATTAWTTAGGDYAVPAGRVRQLDTSLARERIRIGDMVQSWLDGSRSNHGVLLKVRLGRAGPPGAHRVLLGHRRDPHL
jgi:hypothetical protein